MKIAPVDKVIDAAGMGLSMAETCRLLDVSRTQIRNIAIKYGIKFVSGHAKHGAEMRGKPRPTGEQPMKSKRDPYAAKTEAHRRAAYKKRMSEESDRQIKMEITYGYCLYEFELKQHVRKLRPSLPCRSYNAGLEAKQEAVRRQQEQRAERMEQLISDVQSIQPATAADLAEHMGYNLKSVTSLLQRIYMSGRFERKMCVGGETNHRRWAYWVPEE